MTVVAGYEHYDIQDEDPYLIPGSSCLLNSLGITDTRLLNEAEEKISAAAYAELIQSPVEPTFDLHHLCLIHQWMFSDIYPWAGMPRHTEISKGGNLFLPYRLIEAKAIEVFADLHDENLLRNLTKTDFATRAGYFLGRINAIHPFREGNGRTQRILLDQLAELSGFAFDWSAISGEQMALACRAARQHEADFSKLSHLLRLHIILI